MATTVDPNGLLEWFQDPNNKCYFNSKDLAVKPTSNGTGVGVFAKTNLDPAKAKLNDLEPNLLLRVHKSMTLNGKNCAVSNLIYDEGIDGIDGVLIAVIYEIELQDKSPWFGYLKSINHTTDPKSNITHLVKSDPDVSLAKSKKDAERYILPVPFWDEKELDLLVGSEVEILDGLDDSQLRYHYAVAITFAKRVNNSMKLPIPYILQNPLPAGNEGEDQQEEEEEEFDEIRFKQFASLFLAISSRAFDVDNYRDLALVPGADLFNHDSFNEENVHFVTLGEVCPYCGKDACGHGEHGPPDSEEESEEEEQDDEGVEEAIEQLTEITMDYVETMERELAESEAEAEEDEDSEEEYDEDLDPIIAESYLDPDECCDIVLERKVKKGDEVFNTYGDLSNAELLIKYGFCVDSNPNDTLTFGPEVSQYVGSLVQKIDDSDDADSKDKMSRLNWWITYGYKALNEYIEIQSRHEDDHDHQGEGEEEEEDEPEEEKEEEEKDGCCDEDDCNGCEDDEYEWMETCKLGFPGHFNGFAIAVATLLTTSAATMTELLDAFEDEELMAAPGYAGAFVEKKLILESDKKTNTFLKDLINLKLTSFNDNNKSGDLKRMVKKANGRKQLIYTILMNEKKMLEFALKKLK